MPSRVFHRLAAGCIFLKTCPIVAHTPLVLGALGRIIHSTLSGPVSCWHGAVWTSTVGCRIFLEAIPTLGHLAITFLAITLRGKSMYFQLSLSLVPNLPGPFQLHLHKRNVWEGTSEWRETMVLLNCSLSYLAFLHKCVSMGIHGWDPIQGPWKRPCTEELCRSGFRGSAQSTRTFQRNAVWDRAVLANA